MSIGGIALHLRGEVKGIFFDWLRSQRPDLLPLYERLYARGAYAPPAERRRLAALVRRAGRGRAASAPPRNARRGGGRAGRRRRREAPARAAAAVLSFTAVNDLRGRRVRRYPRRR